jgi:phytoene/squalene synthetase
MKFQCERTRSHFAQGRPLCDTLPHPRLKWELRLTWLGGMAILEKIEPNDYNIFKRPTVTKRDWLRCLYKSWRWQK